MKKFLVMAAMMLSSVGAFAQYEAGDITIQPKVGLNVSDITDFPLSTDTKAGLTIGVEGEYHINNWLGVSAGAMYSQQGPKLKIDGVTDDVKLNLDYINVPVLANFYVAKGLALKAGLQAGFKVNDKIKVGSESMEWSKFCKAVGANELEVNSFDLTVPVGVSYEYLGFTLDARYNVGATKIFKGDDRGDDQSTKHSVFQLTLGYKFKL